MEWIFLGMVVRLRKDKQFRFMKVCNQPQEAKNASFRQRSFPALSSYKFFAFFMIRFRETNFQDNHKTHFRTFFSRSWSLGVLSPPINLFFNTHLSLLKRKKKLFVFLFPFFDSFFIHIKIPKIPL